VKRNKEQLCLFPNYSGLVIITVAYRIERSTVGEDKLNVSNELLDGLIVVEVHLVQTTSYCSQVHRRHYDLVVVRYLVHTPTRADLS